MISFSLEEAQLYRMLGELFGKDRVIPGMSVLGVCGGALPDRFESDRDFYNWAKNNRCLFTIVDHEDLPKVVVEFSHDFSLSVEVSALEHRRHIAPILAAAGIVYLTISSEEFDEVLSPEGDIDFPTLLRVKFEEAKIA